MQREIAGEILIHDAGNEPLGRSKYLRRCAQPDAIEQRVRRQQGLRLIERALKGIHEQPCAFADEFAIERFTFAHLLAQQLAALEGLLINPGDCDGGHHREDRDHHPSQCRHRWYIHGLLRLLRRACRLGAASVDIASDQVQQLICRTEMTVLTRNEVFEPSAERVRRGVAAQLQNIRAAAGVLGVGAEHGGGLLHRRMNTCDAAYRAACGSGSGNRQRLVNVRVRPRCCAAGRLGLGIPLENGFRLCERRRIDSF